MSAGDEENNSKSTGNNYNEYLSAFGRAAELSCLFVFRKMVARSSHSVRMNTYPEPQRSTRTAGIQMTTVFLFLHAASQLWASGSAEAAASASVRGSRGCGIHWPHHERGGGGYLPLICRLLTTTLGMFRVTLWCADAVRLQALLYCTLQLSRDRKILFVFQFAEGFKTLIDAEGKLSLPVWNWFVLRWNNHVMFNKRCVIEEWYQHIWILNTNYDCFWGFFGKQNFIIVLKGLLFELSYSNKHDYMEPINEVRKGINVLNVHRRRFKSRSSYAAWLRCCFGIEQARVKA